MTISFSDAERLREAGFTEQEIALFSEAETADGKAQPSIDLGTPIWERVLQSRIEWVQDKVDRGWTQEQIEANIAGYYTRSPKRNPFDFLKAEYKPVKKRDFWAEVRRRAQNKVKASLKGYEFSTTFRGG